MADRRITKAATFREFLLAQSDFLSEELDTKAHVLEKLGLIFCVTFFRVYG